MRSARATANIYPRGGGAYSSTTFVRTRLFFMIGVYTLYMRFHSGKWGGGDYNAWPASLMMVKTLTRRASLSWCGIYITRHFIPAPPPSTVLISLSDATSLRHFARALYAAGDVHAHDQNFVIIYMVSG